MQETVSPKTPYGEQIHKQQAELKAKVDQIKYANQGNTAQGLAGCDKPIRENLRGRLANRLVRMDREENRKWQMVELATLLDKNPEVARILDLIEALQGEV